MLQAFEEIAILWMVEDKRAGLHIGIVGQVGILVGAKGLGSSGVRLDEHLLLGQVARHVILELRKEWLCLLDIDGELGELGVEGSPFMVLHLINLGVCSFLQSFEELRRGHLHKFSERLFNIKSLRARKKLEFFRVDDKVILTEFAEESLQVEAALLQEDDVLVAHGFLRRTLGKNDARPSLDQSIIQGIELVVATLALPFTL